MGPLLTKLWSVAQNQLFAGGALLMMMGSVIALLKDIPKKLYAVLDHQFTSHVNVTDESPAFMAVGHWVQNQRFFKRVRQLDVRNFKGKTNHADLFFIPSTGSHWFFHRWRLMWFRFERTEGKAETKYNENFVLGMLGRNKEFLKQIVTDAAKEMKINSSGVALRVFSEYYWQTVLGYQPRPLDSVILPVGEKQKLTTDMQVFLESEKIYVSSGTPYRRGYLFFGCPGTGKTSLISGLASHFKKDIYYIQPNVLSDEKLSNLMTEIPPHSIVVMEDVDCLASARKRKKKDDDKKTIGVTLSGLLNCLDGLKVPHGLLFFLTTNHVEKLDPALVRPGRVDFRMKFTHATKEQKEEYYQKFLNEPTPVQFVNKVMTMAEVQQAAMARRTENIAS